MGGRDCPVELQKGIGEAPLFDDLRVPGAAVSRHRHYSQHRLAPLMDLANGG